MSVITKSTMYFNIESDNSDYFDSSSEEEEDTEDVLDEISDDEKEDVKYLSVFDSNCVQFDDQIMTLKTVEELNNMESAMVDRTKKGYYCCKTKYEALYKECLSSYAKYCTHSILATLQHNFQHTKINQ